MDYDYRIMFSYRAVLERPECVYSFDYLPTWSYHEAICRNFLKTRDTRRELSTRQLVARYVIPSRVRADATKETFFHRRRATVFPFVSRHVRLHGIPLSRDRVWVLTTYVRRCSSLFIPVREIGRNARYSRFNSGRRSRHDNCFPLI